MKTDEGLREGILYCPNLRQPLSDSGQFRAAKIPVFLDPPADKKRQDLEGEDSGEPRVVDPRYHMEDSRLIHSALGHHYQIAERLDDGDYPRLEDRPDNGLNITEGVFFLECNFPEVGVVNKI